MERNPTSGENLEGLTFEDYVGDESQDLVTVFKNAEVRVEPLKIGPNSMGYVEVVRDELRVAGYKYAAKKKCFTQEEIDRHFKNMSGKYGGK